MASGRHHFDTEDRPITLKLIKAAARTFIITRPSVSFAQSDFSNLQKITCIILRNLFGLDLFSHQSCATGTLLLQKKIYPRKSSLNLKQLIFFMFLSVICGLRNAIRVQASGCWDRGSRAVCSLCAGKDSGTGRFSEPGSGRTLSVRCPCR